MDIIYSFKSYLIFLGTILLINPLDAQSCYAPVFLSSENVRSTSAELVWSPQNGNPAASWEIELTQTGNLPTGMPTHTNINTIPLSINGLQPYAHYFFYVREICPSGTSNWYGPHYFTTAISNPSACPANVYIVDNNCNDSHNYEIDVTNTPGSQLGLDVKLDEIRLVIQHDWIDDLDIWLISPSGNIVEISTDNGGTAENMGNPENPSCSEYTSFVYNSCTAIPVEDGEAPFYGDFFPEQELADFNDHSNPEGVWTLRICDDAGGHIGELEFVELVFAPLVCDEPGNVAALSTGSDFVTLDWTPPAFCENFVIEYGPSGFTPGSCNTGSGNIVEIDCNTPRPFTLTGLSPLTNYDLYIRTLCANGNCSGNACPVQFSTVCALAPISLQTDFDLLDNCINNCGASCNLSGIWKNSTEDDYDWIVHSGSTTSPATGPSDGVGGGGKYIYGESTGSQCSFGKKAFLEASCLDVIAPEPGCHLSFYYHLFGPHAGTLSLLISTDQGENFTALWTTSGDQGDSWQNTFIDLSLYHGETAVFRFEIISGNGFNGDLALDEIVFYGTTNQGQSNQVYYFDQDQDGYGDATNFISSCSPDTPFLYTTNPGDCDDNNPGIYPDAEELICNGIDENCNGNTDDMLTTNLPITFLETCAGTPLHVQLEMPAGDYFWFGDPFSNEVLFTGHDIVLQGITENTIYYVADSLLNICSGDRIPVLITVKTTPDIFVANAPEICKGDTYDLNALNIIDTNNSFASFSFYENNNGQPGNELTNTLVYPSETTDYFIIGESFLACTDTTTARIIVSTLPEFNTPLEDITVCTSDEVLLEINANGNGPFDYHWSDGFIGNTRTINSAATIGHIDHYAITLTDGNYCSIVDDFYITTTNIFASISDITHTSACNGNDGSISLSLTGNGPFQINWTGPVPGSVSGIDTAFQITNLQQGLYSIEVTDNSASNCLLALPDVLLSIGGTAANIELDNIAQPSCNGANDGAILVTVTGSNPGIMWSNGSAEEDQTNLPPGTYSITVVDGTCDNSIEQIVIEEPASIVVNEQLGTLSCNDYTDGAIQIFAEGGTPPYLYLWNNAATTPNLENLAAGDYSLTVTDENNCTATFNYQITEPSLLEAILNNSQNVDCYGYQNGAINISAAGGQPPYNYIWNNGTVGANLTQLYGGQYIVTISDQNGCEAINIYNIFEPSPLSFGLNEFSDFLCFEENNGYIDLNVSGGSGTYSFQWNNGSTAEDLSNLTVGQYIVTVSDVLGCSLIENFTIFQAPNFSLQLSQLNHLTCPGEQDGSIQVVTTGGSGFADYYWSNGETGNIIENLSLGSYSVTAVDARGCTASLGPLLITATETFSVNIESSNTSCHKTNDGAIDLEIEGGTPPYQILWNDGCYYEDLQHLSAGFYQANITDANGCLQTTPLVQITEPEEIDISIDLHSNIDCHSEQNGEIQLSISGGLPPYSYNWNNGSNTLNIQQLTAGEYQLTLTDDSGCTKISNILEITAPPPLHVGVDTIRHIVCYGENDGVIYLTTFGGIAPYSFSWSNGQTTPWLKDVPANIYAVTVTDANQCEIIVSNIGLFEPAAAFEAHISIQNPIRCNGVADAAIILNLSGGTGPFQYNWSNGDQSFLHEPVCMIENLSQGQYSATITDAVGCVITSAVISITEPGALEIAQVDINHESCSGSADGAVSVQINGGQPPYTYYWNNGHTSEQLSQIGSGNYAVTITDSNGCNLYSQFWQIQSPQALQLYDSAIQHSTCFGYQDGQISLLATGGTGTLNYLWSDGSESPVLDGIAAGTYHCTITDENACSLHIENLLVEGSPSPLLIEMTDISHNNCAGDYSGSITPTVSGGAPPYIFNWSNGSIEQEIHQLQGGFYQLTLADTFGCITTNGINGWFVSEPAPIYTEFEAELATPGMNDGSLSIELTGGTPPFLYLWDAQTNSQQTATATNLSAGYYSVTITDFNGCSVVETLLLENAPSTGIEAPGTPGFHFDLYPNPANDFTEVALTFPEAMVCELRLYSVNGQQILQKYIPATKHFEWHMPLATIPSGLYFLEARNDRFRKGKVLVIKKE